MPNKVVLITGANGEVGHGLIAHICKQGNAQIVALDIQPLEDHLRTHCARFIQGDVLDPMLIGQLICEYEFDTIYHLASILSTKAEHHPLAAHRVNVEGTLNLLRLAAEQSKRQGRSVKFIYPSSIAVYGLPDVETKTAAGKVREDQFCLPTTMYGCNKLYCEHLGRYHARFYQRLTPDQANVPIDFRCLRYPGLISAVTIPTGGTSDYGPEMLHHAAQGRRYACFVRPEAQLPFMVMPDAVDAIVKLQATPEEKLKRHVYNVTSFSLTAEGFLHHVRRAFPKAVVDFQPDRNREAIVDSWPADIEDGAARQDWGWAPAFDEDRAFEEYLIPGIKKHYQEN